MNTGRAWSIAALVGVIGLAVLSVVDHTDRAAQAAATERRLSVLERSLAEVSGAIELSSEQAEQLRRVIAGLRTEVRGVQESASDSREAAIPTPVTAAALGTNVSVASPTVDAHCLGAASENCEGLKSAVFLLKRDLTKDEIGVLETALPPFNETIKRVHRALMDADVEQAKVLRHERNAAHQTYKTVIIRGFSESDAKRLLGKG